MNEGSISYRAYIHLSWTGVYIIKTQGLYLSKYLLALKRAVLWKTTGDLHPRLVVGIGRRVFGIRSGYNFHRLVEHVISQLGDLFSFDVSVVIVHVACTLDDGQLQSKIVAESRVVASLCHLVTFLNDSKSLVQHDNLVAGFTESTFSITQSEAFVKRSDSGRHLEQWKLLQDNNALLGDCALLYTFLPRD